MLDNRELIVNVSEDVEIKLAPGMVTDLYTINDNEKKSVSNKDNSSEKNKNILSGIFSKKEK